MDKQRARYRKDKLARNQIDRLEGIGFVWSPFDEIWEAKFKILLEYKTEVSSTIMISYWCCYTLTFSNEL